MSRPGTYSLSLAEMHTAFVDPFAWNLLGISVADIPDLVSEVQMDFDLALELWDLY